MKHLDIEFTHPIKELISKCLGTYLDLLGHDDTVVEFYKEYKIPYKVNNWESYCRYPVYLPEKILKTDYSISNEPFYKLEKWK